MYKYFIALTLTLQGLCASNTPFELKESNPPKPLETYKTYFTSLEPSKKEAIKKALYPDLKLDDSAFTDTLHISKFEQDRNLQESVSSAVIPMNYDVSTITFLNVEFQSQVRMVFKVDYGNFKNKFAVLTKGQNIPATYHQLTISNDRPTGSKLEEFHPLNVDAVFHEWTVQNQSLDAMSFQFGNRSLPFTLNFIDCKGTLIFSKAPKGLNFDTSQSPGLILYYEN